MPAIRAPALRGLFGNTRKLKNCSLFVIQPLEEVEVGQGVFFGRTFVGIVDPGEVLRYGWGSFRNLVGPASLHFRVLGSVTPACDAIRE